MTSGHHVPQTCHEHCLLPVKDTDHSPHLIRASEKADSDYRPSSWVSLWHSQSMSLWGQTGVGIRQQWQCTVFLEYVSGKIWKSALWWQREGWAVPYTNDLVFNKTKKKHRYICQANAHLRAAESWSEKQSCNLLVSVIQSIFYDQIVIKHYYNHCSCRFYMWMVDTAVSTDSWATTQDTSLCRLHSMIKLSEVKRIQVLG